MKLNYYCYCIILENKCAGTKRSEVQIILYKSRRHVFATAHMWYPTFQQVNKSNPFILLYVCASVPQEVQFWSFIVFVMGNFLAIQFLFPIYVSFSGPRTYGARDRRLPNEDDLLTAAVLRVDRTFEVWNFIIRFITIKISYTPRNLFKRVDSFLTFLFFFIFHWLVRVDGTLSFFFSVIRIQYVLSYKHITRTHYFIHIIESNIIQVVNCVVPVYMLGW